TNQISGGELMRVAIARAIVQNPKVILADEPTGTLDSHNGEIIAELLITMATPNCSVVFVTHSRDFALKADRIMYLKDGCLDVT
ncbi:MAG: ATP-binding cassette domain-containing protein, partial [Candidatus Omnitrophica bacterium]|nr:ATP-binding cassette domain-containing protein [Candidatus Omnitrophota bacterium]